jgi:ABC-2 type transport system permease protein
MKKEWMEQVRSGRLVILGIIFVFLGVMNPAVAKLTPWMMELVSESMADMGMTITEVQVDAMSSWTQFYKNIPIGLIAFVLMQSGLFTKEYQSGTLVLTLTKGLERYKVVLAKTAILLGLWSAYYWICYAITYCYNDIYWENSIATHLGFAAMCWWLVGILVIAFMVLFSALMDSNTAVLTCTGGMFLAVYLLGLLPKVKEYTPAMLMGSSALLTGGVGMDAYCKAIMIAIVMCIASVALSIPVMDKRKV